MKTKLALYLIPLVLIILSGSFTLAWTNPIGNPPAGGGIIGAESGAPINSIRIRSTGNVGIGTATPMSRLHVLTGGTSGLTAQMNRGITITDSAGPRLILEDTSQGVDGKVWVLRNEAGLFSVNALNDAGSAWVRDNALVLNRAGNVGIGTTNPATTLDVAGTARMTGFQLGTTATAGHVLTANASGVGAWAPPATTTTLNAANVSAGAFGANTGGGNYSFSGNLGIGTATPGGRLAIATTGGTAGTQLVLQRSDAGNANAAIRWQTSAGINQAGIGSNFNVVDAGNIEFLNNVTTNMILTSAGNVGIGTTTPGFRLDVAGTIRAGNSANPTWGDIITSQINSNRVYAYERLCVGNTFGNCDGAGGVVIGNTTGTVSLTTGISFFNGGNVGIGTTGPRARLEAAGGSLGTVAGNAVTIGKFGALTGNDDRLIHEAIRITGGTGWDTASHRIRRRVDVTDMGYIQLGHNVSDLITFGEGNTEYMRIDGNGNVGIGTTSPAHRLDVAGTARISGALDMATQRITNVATPITASDVATRGWVEALGGGGGGTLITWGYDTLAPTIAGRGAPACPVGWSLVYEGFGWVPIGLTHPSSHYPVGSMHCNSHPGQWEQHPQNFGQFTSSRAASGARITSEGTGITCRVCAR